MRKILFACSVLIIASSATVDLARAQPYVPQPANPVDPVVPGYAPNYAPSVPSGAPGFQWRDQRGDSDWRNNTWREDRVDQDWRNGNWQTRREVDDWRQRQDYSKIRTPNNATDRGYVECGKGPAGSSTPCENYTKNNPSGRTDGYEGNENVDRKKTEQRGVENCGHGAVWRRC
jgi:hypothetical protein